MKKSLAIGLVLSALVPMTAHAGAWEVGVFADQLKGKSALLNADTTDLKGGIYDAMKTNGFGVRLAYDFLNLHVANLGAVVTYRPKSTTDLSSQSGLGNGRIGENYVAAGVQADWRFLVNIHAGLEMRHETITTAQDPYAPPLKPVQTFPSDNTVLNRTWATIGFGFQAPLPEITPFVRLEVAAPLSKPENTGNGSDDFRKAMAPSLQVALYGGIRF